VIVDLETGDVRAGGLTLPVEVAPDARRRIMAGTDLVGETLALGNEIAAFEAQRSDLKPSVRPA
jgi:3-isopropylmalate dehydratase small subunit